MEIIFGLSLWKSIEVFLDWGFKLTFKFSDKSTKHYRRMRYNGGL